MAKKPRIVPFSLTNLRRAATVAREMNLDLEVNQSGGFTFKTSRGNPVDPPPIDGRSIAANYPHRSDPSHFPKRQKSVAPDQAA
jgi:hypothetical protein